MRLRFSSELVRIVVFKVSADCPPVDTSTSATFHFDSYAVRQ